MCTKCGYSATVSGGRDVGMEAVVKTMTCEDCKEVVDVRIGSFGEDGPIGDPECDENLNTCLLCRGRNVRPWPRRHPCPQCDGEMNKDDGFEMLWD
jgi:hypothetical protein